MWRKDTRLEASLSITISTEDRERLVGRALVALESPGV